MLGAVEFVFFALQILTYIIIGDAVLSWVQKPHQMPRKLTMKLTDPLYYPIRKILDPQKMGGIDLSPIVLIFGIQALRSFLAQALL